MKKLIALAVLMVLANCDIKPRTTQAQSERYVIDNNKEIIARDDRGMSGSCVLYKVTDDFHVIFWSVCSGNLTSSVSSK